MGFAAASGCRSSDSSSSEGSPSSDPNAAPEARGDGVAAGPGAHVKPPFPVQGELEGLLLVWFDAEGLHTAQKRSDIPESARAQVRVDSLNIEPDARLDPEQVYVADLRTPGAAGSYPVRQVSRGWFDAQVDRAKPRPANADAPVVVYKASWCGVCRSAAAFLRSRHVPFIEKDVEKEPGANEEMLRKARAKGLTPRGVPVIDFKGEIMLGFDRAHIEALLDGKAI